MADIKRTGYGNFTIFCFSELIEPTAFINEFLNAKVLGEKGRGGIRIVTFDGKAIACRQYIHGGLLRGLTGNLFFTGKRAIREMEMLMYLKDNGFPVVQPYCVLIEKRILSKIPYLLTILQENTIDLMELFKRGSAKDRLRVARKLAELFWRLENLGVYHPDLHPGNVLVDRERNLFFLDFDKSYRKQMKKKDMAKMFWRLDRFAEKMEIKGNTAFDAKEKILFLRTYKRLSGYDIITVMKKQMGAKRLWRKMGWFIESLLYGGRK